MFFILSLEIKQIGENAAETYDVDDWNEHDHQSECNNIERLPKIFAYLSNERISDYDLHLWLPFLGVLVIGFDNLVVTNDKGRLLLLHFLVYLHRRSILEQRCSHFFALHC